MNPKFQASVHNREDVTYVKLSGVIDEDNELASLSDKIGSGTAVIDVSEIERINSCGVRDWVNWLGQGREERRQGHAGGVLAGDRRADQPGQQLHRPGRRQELLRPVLLPQLRPREGAPRRDARPGADAAVQGAVVPLRRVRWADGLRRHGGVVLRVLVEREEDRDRLARRQRHQRVHARPTGIARSGRARATRTRDRRRARSRGRAACTRARCRRFRRCRRFARRRGRGPARGRDRSRASTASGSGVSGVRSTAAALAELEARRSQTSPTPLAPSKSNAAWIVVVVLIIVAVGLLGFVMFGGKH